MKRILLVAVALAVIAVAGVLLFGRTSQRDPAHDGVPAGGAPGESAGPALAPLDAGPRGSNQFAAEHVGRGSISGTVRRGPATAAARIEVCFLAEAIDDRPGGPGFSAWLQRMFEVPRPAAGPTASARAEGDGRYVVEGLASGTYRVTAVAEDGARGQASVTLAADGARVVADLALGRGTHTLSGHVVGTDGRPFTGAVFVDPFPFDGASWAPSPGVALPLDPEGRFLLTGLERGEVVLTAIVAGTLSVRSRRVEVPHVGDFVLVVGEGLTLRAGRVVAADDGEPVAGARVMGGGVTAEALALTRASTAADGRFEILLPVGGGGLRVQAAGFVPARKDLADLPLGPETIEFRLARGARLEGRVTSAADGTPVPGIAVHVIPDDRSTRWFAPDPDATDADGHYSVADLPAVEAVAFAESGDWVTEGVATADASRAGSLRVALTAGQTTTLDLRVVRAASAIGVVRDVAGAPVAGAVVRAEGRQGPGRYYYLGLLENLGPGDTATADDGSFAIRGLAAGVRYVFTARTPDAVVAHSALLMAREDPPLEVEIRLAPRRDLTVAVLDDVSAAPLAGAEVTAARAEEDAILREARVSATTGADGKARLALRVRGLVRLTVSADGYLTCSEAPVRDGETSPVIRLARAYVVSGSVVLPDGSPAVEAQVETQREDGDADDPVYDGCRADAKGEFRLAYRSAGPKAVRATFHRGDQDLDAVAVATAGGEPVVLRLAPRSERKPTPGTLTVRVLDPDGKPVPRARVCLRGPSDLRNAVEDGVAEFRARERDGAWVFVWDAATRDGTPLPLGPAQAGPLSATTNEVAVRLPHEQRIEGVVLGPDGKGVRGIVVAAEWGAEPDSDRGGAAGTEARTDSTGAFRLGRVGTGECTLTASVPPEFVPPERATARGGATGIEIRLRAATRVKVTVLDDEGRPVAGATVSARRIGSTVWSSDEDVTTDADGVARPGWLDAGAGYVLEVRRWRDQDLLPFEQDEWSPSDTTVRLSRSFTIRGVVRDATGRPVPRARVMVLRDDGAALWTADDEGRFVLGGLAEGEHEVSASLPGAFGRPGPTVRVAAGVQDVVLTLDTGLALVVRIDNWPAGGRPSQAPTLLAQGTPRQATLSGEVLPDGTVGFRGLEAGRAYTLWVPPVGDGLSLLRRDVRAGAGDLDVTLSRGRSITGRIVLPAGAHVRGVTATRDEEALSVPGIANPDGTYEVRGLPEGTWCIRVAVARGRDRVVGEAEAPAGGTVDVVIE